MVRPEETRPVPAPPLGGYVDDLPSLLRAVYASLRDIGVHLPQADAADDQSVPEDIEDEITQIYQRIDRGLDVEEERADRLLRQYRR